MFAQLILIPLVVFALTGSDVPFFSGDVAGEKTVQKTDERRQEYETPTATPSPSEGAEDGSPSGSAVIQEGESSVNIDISNESNGRDESRENSGSLPLQDFIYPGAQVVSESGQSVRLQSNTSHEVITEWYENSIEQRGMNIQSFVKTSSNGKILNKLGGAGNSNEILVEISKEPSSDTTSISVEFK